ncbi:hypothetical protein B296_00030798 [Ensete ventricosum]|uniref:Nodulin-like domain-containing protein n=1 Tax=Ensete ventricosum TaxID=4639 RepID=A0A427AHY7_ENSVE|nr:hypothetical protein B296_00030798 [Ensete ventricosum]
MTLKARSRPPRVGLAAALWVQVAAGSACSLPLYSPALKSVLGYNQQQLTVFGVANEIGEHFGLIACDLFPPWLLLLLRFRCSLSRSPADHHGYALPGGEFTTTPIRMNYCVPLPFW